jgi:hypothetical protein
VRDERGRDRGLGAVALLVEGRDGGAQGLAVLLHGRAGGVDLARHREHHLDDRHEEDLPGVVLSAVLLGQRVDRLGVEESFFGAY